MKTTISRKCDIFQSAFEKRVSLVQTEVREIEKLAPLYNVAREVLDIPNDTRLSLSIFGVTAQVTAIEADTFYRYNQLAGEIGTRLKAAGLHPDGLPALRLGGWHHSLEYTWRCRTPGDRLGLRRALVLDVATPRHRR